MPQRQLLNAGKFFESEIVKQPLPNIKAHNEPTAAHARLRPDENTAPPAGPFADLGLIAPLLRALHEEGYETPTPIQVQAIPPVLEGRDVLGCAQTGTGKTAAFALPILQRLASNAQDPNAKRVVRVLVLAPTRELAIQIGESFGAYGRHIGKRHTVIFGGVGQQPQVDALRRHPEIIVATPGRLLDLMGQGFVRFNNLSVLVLDEADRMLDMGFIHDIRKIIATIPEKRQTLFFSATMPPEIQSLADGILNKPVMVAVAPISATADAIEQSLYFVEKSLKPKLLVHLLHTNAAMSRTLVFTRTKHGANRVSEALLKAGIRSDAIHGNKSQSARQRALADFKAGRTRVLVASDIASRGLDIDEVTHVINLDLPEVPETYVHRIGRTGRMDATGNAISFCSADERSMLREIERLTRQQIEVIKDHPFVPGSAAAASAITAVNAEITAQRGMRNGGRPVPTPGRPAPSGNGRPFSGRTRRPTGSR